MSGVPNTDWRKALPTIAADMVAVREVIAADAPALFELLTDPLVTEHISAPPPSISAFEGFIAWAQRERALGNAVCFGIVPHGLEHAVGLIQVRALEPTFFVAEWGFAVGAAFWSTGVFQEGANLVTRFAFDVLKVHRLEARAVSHNARGSAALQKLGASAEAVLAKSFRRKGHYEEQLLWTLIATEQGIPAPERLGATEAKDRIRRAVAATTEQLKRSKSNATLRPPTLYPFFVTDNRRDRLCPVCGTRIFAEPCPVCR
jgi:RimJ/RimL family protein N-acetyltransferase